MTKTTKVLALVLASVLLLSGCASRRSVGETVFGEAYVYIEVSPGTYHVLISGMSVLKKAVAEICGQQACIVERGGEVFVVYKARPK